MKSLCRLVTRIETRELRTRSVSLLPAICAAIGLLAAQAFGQSSSSVRHDFELRPGHNAAPSVTGRYYAHAWEEDGCLPQSHDVQVSGQGGNWNPFGLERLSNNGMPEDANGKPVLQGSATIPITGVGPTIRTATAGPSASFGQGTATFQLNPLGAGGVVSGWTRAQAVAQAVICNNGPGTAYAFAYSRITTRGGWALDLGQIRWRPMISGDEAPRIGLPSGGPSDALTHMISWDPIVATWVDKITGETIQAILLSIDARASGKIDWGPGGLVQVDSQSLDLEIVMDSQLAAQQGRLSIRARDGVITQAESSGVFASVQLPQMSSQAKFGLALPEFVIDYHLPGVPGDANDDGVVDNKDLSQVMADFGKTGKGLASDLNHDGIVDDKDLSIVRSNMGRGPGSVEITLDFSSATEAIDKIAPNDTPTGGFRGRVVDGGTGQPLDGASIVIVDPHGITVSTESTNRKGKYNTGLLPIDSFFDVFCELGGYEPQQKQATLRDGITRLNFALNGQARPQPGGVYGQVEISPDGTPFDGAIVAITDESGRTIFSGASDASGFYDTGLLLPSGNYTVACSAAGYIQQHQTVTVNNGSSARADFALIGRPQPAAGGIDGLVEISPNGTPFEGALIAITDDLGRPVFSGVTNPAGFYDTGLSLPAGNYTVACAASGSIAQQKSARVTEGTRIRVDFVVTRTQPDFHIDVELLQLDIVSGQGGQDLVKVTSSGGFSNPVTFSCSGQPQGVTCDFGPNPVTPPSDGVTQSTMKVSVDQGVAPGTYLLQIAGESGILSHGASVQLTVRAPHH